MNEDWLKYWPLMATPEQLQSIANRTKVKQLPFVFTPFVFTWVNIPAALRRVALSTE